MSLFDLELELISLAEYIYLEKTTGKAYQKKTYLMVYENPKKVSFNIASEASYVYKS